MAVRAADIQVVSTLDLSGMISRRLADAERAVFNRHRRKILAFIMGKWTGWRYDGRPESAPRNVSQSAWTSTIETTEADAVALVIRNEARDYRTDSKAYVGYVHRRGATKTEAEVVFDALAVDMIPPLVADLTAEIEKRLNEPAKPQKLRKGGGNTVRAAAMEI